MLNWFRVLGLRIHGLVFRRRLDEEFQQEIDTHLEMLTEENLHRGLAPEEARRTARVQLGGITQLRETNREMWGLPWIETFFQDLRYGLRQLRHNPGFTVVAVLTLALGIGANVAIFSVINAVMLRTLPVHDPEQLVLLAWQGKVNGQSAVVQMFSYPDFKDLRQHNQVFTGLMAFWGGYRGTLEAHLESPGSATAGKSLHVEMVSANYFSLLGVNALVGRTFTRDEDNGPGAHPVAVISYGLWTRLFARNAAVLGKKITIVNTPFTIVGVAPAHFTGVRSGRVCDVWVPVSMQPQVAKGLSLASPMPWLNLVGRLKPGVSMEQARADMDVLYLQIQRQQNGSRMPAQGRQGAFVRHIVLLPAAHGTDYLRNQFKEPLLLLMAMVTLVLLIACINVSNLLLARASARQPEIAVRLALGAGRRRLVRQLLTESILLALVGAALGVLFAYWGSPFLVVLMSHKNLIRGWNQVTLNVHPDLRVLIFTALVVLITGIAFGLAPALRATRMPLSPCPQHLTTRRSGRRLGRMLVVAQVALSLVMVIGAGLLVGTFHNLETLNPGFNRHNVLLFFLDPSKAGYKKPERAAQIRHEVYERLQQMPGVKSVSYSVVTPIGGGHFRVPVAQVEGYTPSPGENMQINMNLVGPHYFRTLSMAMVRGRDFGPQDQVGSTFAAVINQAMAQCFFGSRNPVGKHFQLGQFGPPKLRYEVVGVVEDARRNSLRQVASPGAYLYIPQFPRSMGAVNYVTFEVRSAIPPMSLVPQVRRLLQDTNSRLAPDRIRTLAQQLGWSLYQEKMMSALSSFFGLLALVLACVGLYGTLSYAVARRTNEIGIRIALGARRHDILRMVLGEALLLAAVGIAIGLPAAWAATRTIASMLYGLKATDPLTTLGGTLLMAAVAVLAGYIPARRAAKVDPMVALRYE